MYKKVGQFRPSKIGDFGVQVFVLHAWGGQVIACAAGCVDGLEGLAGKEIKKAREKVVTGQEVEVAASGLPSGGVSAAGTGQAAAGAAGAAAGESSKDCTFRSRTACPPTH